MVTPRSASDNEAKKTILSQLCTCQDCGTPIMLDDTERRIRVAVPNVMGYDDARFPEADYHAFWDESKGYARFLAGGRLQPTAHPFFF